MLNLKQSVLEGIKIFGPLHHVQMQCKMFDGVDFHVQEDIRELP